MAKNKTIAVKGTELSIIKDNDGDIISMTDMLKAKDGDFFIADWLRNRNTVEFWDMGKLSRWLPLSRISRR